MPGGARHALDGLLDRWGRFGHKEEVLLTAAAVAIGVISGYGSVGFRLGIEMIQGLVYGFDRADLLELAALVPWWMILFGPAAGGVIVGLFIRYVMPGQRPHAVADVIEASARHGGRMSLGTGLGAAAVSIVSLGFGASAGREGPVVHLGAALASLVARIARLPRSSSLTLLGCGVASAIAASFNAPIAGVFFALEVVIGSYAVAAFAPIVISSVVGTIVCRVHIGDFPAFLIPEYAINSLWEVPAFALLGGVCGVVAMIFMWSIMFVEDTANRLRLPIALRPVLGGLAVGMIALFLPQVLGVGYSAMDDALRENYELLLLISLVVFKTTATAITLGCRFGGGVFSPSLFLGSMTGGAFGIIAAAAFPDLSAGHGLYAMVGMGAVAAAVLGAPISTTLIVFELTGDYKITIAVMIAVAISTLLTQSFFVRSLFHWQLERRRVRLTSDRTTALMRQRRVREVMRTNPHRIRSDMSIADIQNVMKRDPNRDFIVFDGRDRLLATFSSNDMAEAIRDGEDNATLQSGEIAVHSSIKIEEGRSLHDAMKLMEHGHEDCIAVISADGNEVLGILHYKDLLLAFNDAVLKARSENRKAA